MVTTKETGRRGERRNWNKSEIPSNPAEII